MQEQNDMRLNEGEQEAERLRAKRKRRRQVLGKVIRGIGHWIAAAVRAAFKFFLALPAIAKSVVVVALLGLIALGVFGVTSGINAGKPTEVLTSTSLEKVVRVSKLSTADFSYEGIAEKVDGEGNVVCHVFYRARIGTTADLGETTFAIDDDAKKVYPQLPKITISEPVIDDSSFDYFESNPNISMSELMTICKQDAYNEISKNGDVLGVARENLKKTVSALTEPVLQVDGYEISWDEEAREKLLNKQNKENGSASDQVSAGSAQGETK